MQNFIGQILDGKYRIEKELGRGGMGAVYFAVHLGTKRPVAVKVIVPQLMKRAEFVERFKREAEAAGRLRHPNVVNVTDFGFAETRDGQAAYLVMEYLDGCSLGEILAEEKKLPLLWTVDILEQVASAIDEAHRQGIIHRDLKPDNIWLEPNERGGYTAKVLDFGIAKLEEPATANFNRKNNSPMSASNRNAAATQPFAESENNAPLDAEGNLKTRTGYETVKFNLENLASSPSENFVPTEIRRNATLSNLPTVTDKNEVNTAIFADKFSAKSALFEKTTADITRVGAMMGTPLYMSPEQCRTERPSSSSDIYSLGVIAYQMLSGRTPFAGEQLSVIAGHLQSAPPALPFGRIPRKVKKTIYGALAKEPVNRPRTAEIFAGQMRSYSEKITQIFRRAVLIYTEIFYKLIWFSLLLYFPTILLAFLSFIIAVLSLNKIIPPVVSTIVSGILKYANLAATVAAETLVIGAVMWIVVQFIETPLRSFSVVRAFSALARKWKQFAWILPLRIVINWLIQGDFPAFSAPVMFVLSLLDSFIFWCLPCVVMMENIGGFSALKRSWKLTIRAFPTVTAALILNLILLTTATVAVTSVVFGLTAIVTKDFFPLVDNLSLEEFTKFIESPALILTKITGTILLPFFAVVTSLVYLKTRYAGGESTKKLLEEFKQANVVQSNWQRKIRQRLEQSGRLSNTF